MTSSLASNLFQQGSFQLSSGQSSDFKIECNALTGEDWSTLANVISQRIHYTHAVGVPSGGLDLARALNLWRPVEPEGTPILIVDDVCTTGRSMLRERDRQKNRLGHDNFVGVVVFARRPTPAWIIPVFQMWAR